MIYNLYIFNRKVRACGTYHKYDVPYARHRSTSSTASCTAASVYDVFRGGGRGEGAPGGPRGCAIAPSAQLAPSSRQSRYAKK